MSRRALACSYFVWFLAVSAAAGPAELRVAPFVRFEDLRWSIADSDGDPNILSELKWTDLVIFGLEAQGDVALAGPWELRGRARAGWVVVGDNRDSDYNLDDRQGEWSRSNNDASGGLAWDLSLALSYRLRATSRLSLLPQLGMEVAQRRLRMTDGFQTIPLTGPFEGLDSRYISTWFGPWVGAEALVDTGDGSALRIAASYHLVGYYAAANWNLRPDFQHPKSFEHSSWGQALRASVGVEAEASRSTLLALQVEMAMAAAEPGTDRTFGIDGTVGETRLNGVWWQSLGLSAGARLRL